MFEQDDLDDRVLRGQNRLGEEPGRQDAGGRRYCGGGRARVRFRLLSRLIRIALRVRTAFAGWLVSSGFRLPGRARRLLLTARWLRRLRLVLSGRHRSLLGGILGGPFRRLMSRGCQAERSGEGEELHEKAERSGRPLRHEPCLYFRARRRGACYPAPTAQIRRRMALRERFASLAARGRRLGPWGPPGLGAGLFLVAAVDVSSGHEALPGGAVLPLLAAGVGLVALGSRRTASPRAPGRPSRRHWLPLAAGAVLAFGFRVVLGGQPAVGPASAERAADRVDAWLADATRRAGDAAYLLARTPNLAAAVEGSDAEDFRSLAFDVLAAWPVPGTGLAPGGASLYDARLRPVAWSPGATDLEEPLAELFPDGLSAAHCPDPAFPLFLYADRGGGGILAAADCTRTLRGLVTVEMRVLTSPPPSSGAPPRSALEAAAGRGLELQLLRGAEDPEPLAELFSRRGERFLDGPRDAQRLFFPLRAYDGQLLGAASTVVSPASALLAERRGRSALAGAAGLLLGALWVGISAWRRGPAARIAAVWLVRIAAGVLASALPPVASGPGVRAPVLPAGGPLLGLSADFWTGSPIDALLTAAAIFASVRVVSVRLLRRSRLPGGRAGALRGGVAGLLAVLAVLVIERGGSSAATFAPTWRVGVGWAEVLAWAALLLLGAAVGLLIASLLRPVWPAAVAALAVVVGAAAIGPAALGWAVLPVGGAAAVTGWRRGLLALRRLRRSLVSYEPGLAFLAAFGLFALPAVLWYPALESRQEEARRRYAESAAPVQILRHRFTICHALQQARRALDEEANRQGSFSGLSAYSLWSGTGLPHLTAASGLELRRPEGGTSRFGVGLSRRPDPPPSEAAPGEWSASPECAEAELASGREAPRFGDETVLTTRRRFPSGDTVTLRAADRDREIPFLPHPAGIADHFLLRGGTAPAVFDGRDLRLARGAGAASGDALSQPRESVRFDVGEDRFTVSWNATRPADRVTALLGWVLLAALAALLVAAGARIRRLLPRHGRAPPRRSFQMQLTETLAAAVLVAILGLALFAEGRFAQLLEAASDQEAVARSGSALRVASELGAFDLEAPPEELGLRLAHAADQTDTDAAVYAGGALLAVSRTELVQTGLLPSRPPPRIHAAALRGDARAGPEFSLEQVGPLRYRVLWTRLPVRSSLGEPTFLAVPLAADEPARLEGVRALQRSLILGGGSIALVFAILLPGLLARRLAAPVRGLARATGRIADGAPVGSLPVSGTVVELRLLAGSVERLARRIPGVRRRMREEAAADLARRVAHDIKNALAPIGLAADYIKRVLQDPRGIDTRTAVDESVGDIRAQVERLRRISSEFSALGAPLQRRDVDLARLVENTVAPWVRVAEGPEVTVRAPGAVLVRADPEIVARIVENLLLNAVEALRDDAPGERGGGLPRRRGRVEVRVVAPRPAGVARIEVEDDGPGIPERFRERIFEAEFSTRTRGSGLGLANARRFAEAHGGRLAAAARPDGRRGTLMLVELPVDGARDRPASRRPASEGSGARTG